MSTEQEERLMETLEAERAASAAWGTVAGEATVRVKVLEEQLKAARSWYSDHVTEDGIYDAQTWGDPFAVTEEHFQESSRP